MNVKVVLALTALAVLSAIPMAAQEGHPLVGTWSGEWGPSPTHRNHITIVMSWDGKNISGTINPGPDNIPLKTATLDSTKWTVHFEFEAKSPKGEMLKYVADGKLENIGSHNRTLTGTWSHGAVKGDFKITRD